MFENDTEFEEKIDESELRTVYCPSCMDYVRVYDNGICTVCEKLITSSSDDYDYDDPDLKG